MTAKRFKLVEYLPNVIRIEDNHQKLNGHKIVDLLNELHEEKETYKRLFNEMAYYFRDNVKSLNDLDHKDFEALQGLANGEYFDEEVMAWCKVRLEDLE